MAVDLTWLGIDIAFDVRFLTSLLGALQARGLNYVAAAAVENHAVAPLPGVSLVDADVMLVDGDRVTVESAVGRNFTLGIGEIAPGIVLRNGWVGVWATVEGAPPSFVPARPATPAATCAICRTRSPPSIDASIMCGLAGWATRRRDSRAASRGSGCCRRTVSRGRSISSGRRITRDWWHRSSYRPR